MNHNYIDQNLIRLLFLWWCKTNNGAYNREFDLHNVSVLSIVLYHLHTIYDYKRKVECYLFSAFKLLCCCSACQDEILHGLIKTNGRSNNSEIHQRFFGTFQSHDDDNEDGIMSMELNQS